MPHFITSCISALPNEDKKALCSGIDILDVGCGHCHYWIDLYRTIKFKSIVGIDNGGRINFSVVNDLSIPLSEKSVEAGTYKQYTAEHKLIYKEEPVLTEEEFMDVFDRKESMIDAFDYFDELIEEGKQYDFIILGNFIHLTELAKDRKEDLLNKLHKITGQYVYLLGNSPINEEEESQRHSEQEIADILSLHFKVVLRQHPVNLQLYSMMLKKI